jgi:flavin-binding protein dodecin
LVVELAIPAEGERFGDTIGRAAIVVRDVAIVALLGRSDESISALRNAKDAVDRARRSAWRLAILRSGTVDQSVAAKLEHASRAAPITVNCVSIFTLLGRRHESITAQRCTNRTGIRTKSGAGWLASLGARIVDDPVAATL